MLLNLLIVLPILLVSVALHEYAHARVAVAQGDDTPSVQGRVTLNPVAHLDAIGSFVVPLLLWVGTNGSMTFGWAKPVQVNPTRYRDRKRGDILVSSAGVIANFLLAIACLVLALLVVQAWRGFAVPGTVADVGLRAARFGVLINLLLGIFNLIPVPPLDGSHLLYYMLPAAWRSRYRGIARFGFLPLLLILVIPGLLDVLLAPVYWLYGLADGLIRAGFG